MYTKRKSMGAILKLIIGLLALAGMLYEWADLGLIALRLFSFWVLLIAAIYYLTVAAKILVHKQHDETKDSFSMVFEGALLIAGILMCVGFLMIRTTNNFACMPNSELTVQIVDDSARAYCVQWAGPGSPYVTDDSVNSLSFIWPLLIYLLLPVLMFADWVLFTKKGRWRFVDPLYWLAIPIIYVALIFLTAQSAREWTYPYLFLDYNTVGVRETALWICFAGAMIFFVGYVLLVIDYAASGKLGNHIVLPHIRTVVVEEDLDPNSDQPMAQTASTSQKAEVPVSTAKKKSSKQKPKDAPLTEKKAASSPKISKTESSSAAAAKKPATKASAKSSSANTQTAKANSRSKESGVKSDKIESASAKEAKTSGKDSHATKNVKPAKTAEKSKNEKGPKPKAQTTPARDNTAKPKDEFTIPKVIKRGENTQNEPTPKITRSPKIEKFATLNVPADAQNSQTKITSKTKAKSATIAKNENEEAKKKNSNEETSNNDEDKSPSEK